MKKFEEFMNKNWQKVFFFLLVLIFYNTCGNPTKNTNKKIEVLSAKIDSLERTVTTKKDLQIEGLKVEKRMIQSTDRKILDVNRQAAIDAELKKLEETREK
jgi:hypothetical protein